jgi:uncharacterized protein YbjT (DUF2867 family)
MYSGRDFAVRDREAARNFSRYGSKLKHVIYLGGLLPKSEEKVSEHLRSRAEVGEILRENLPTTEFRAGPIIGSGSASFEMVRYLTERLPVMVAPKWILNEVQPVSIGDVLKYLVLALKQEALGIVDVGADRLTFKQMMEIYGEVRGLRRFILPVPVLAPALAALWIGLVTPISNTLAVPLVEGVAHPVVADTEKAERIFPEVKPISYRKAVELGLGLSEGGDIETIWSGALGNFPTYSLSDREGLIREVRSVYVNATPSVVFRSFSSLGGRRGWLVWEWAWRIRGMVDKLIGGPGLRRGRRHPKELLPGETLDFWRVEEVISTRLLRLRAEMRLPGQAWLQWETKPHGTGSRLVQTALFAPVGLWGTVYWYGLYPLHRAIFNDMVKAIARDAESLTRTEGRQGQFK